MMTKKILVYNMPDDYLEVLEDLGDKHNYKILIATDEHQGQLVGDLVEENENVETDVEYESIDINFLMMHNFSEEDLDSFLIDLRENELKIPNKCISTKTNKKWRLHELLKENKEEAELMPILHNLYAVRGAAIDMNNKGVEDPLMMEEVRKIDKLIESRNFNKDEMIERYNALVKLVNSHLA